MVSAIPPTSLLVWLMQVHGHDLVPLSKFRSDDLSLRSSRRIAFAVTQWQVTTGKRKSSLTRAGRRQRRRSRKIPVEESAEQGLRQKNWASSGVQLQAARTGSRRGNCPRFSRNVRDLCLLVHPLLTHQILDLLIYAQLTGWTGWTLVKGPLSSQLSERCTTRPFTQSSCSGSITHKPFPTLTRRVLL